jgi:hypothetical protein
VFYRPVIRQFLAGLLLTVFAFSITPKQALHDWLANHTDKTSSKLAGDKALVSTAGFNCDCDNLVAESPFTATVSQFEFTPPQVFTPRQAFHPHTFYAVTQFFFSLRGPPATRFI